MIFRKLAFVLGLLPLLILFPYFWAIELASSLISLDSHCEPSLEFMRHWGL